MSEIYQRQLAPARATDTLPFAREETFGGELGRAIGHAGDVAGQVNVQNRQLQVERERDMQASAASLAFVRIQEDAATYALDQQESAAPGGAGYTEAVETYLGERESAFLGTIGDEKVRQRFADRFANWRGDTAIRAEAWERGQSVKLTVDNFQQTTNLRANRAARLDGDGFAGELAALKDDVAGLEHVPANVRAALERDGVTEVSVSWIGSRPPEERLALLGSGVFDQLDPQIVKQLTNEAEVDQRRGALEADARARVEKADAKDKLDQLLRELGDGVPKSDADLAAGQALADKWGFDAQTYDIGKARVVGTVNREYAGATPVQIDNAVKALDIRIAKAGDKAQAGDIVRRDALVSLRDNRAKQIADDPAGYGTSLGIEWPELDPADGGSITARRRAADSIAEATGQPPKYLSAEEVTQLQANMGTAEGQRAAVALARGFRGRAAASVISQLAPNDALMLHLTGLAPDRAGVALQGRAVIKSKAYVPPAALDDTFRALLGQSLTGVSAEARGGVLETAKAIYAYYADRDGLPSDKAFESLAGVAIDQALGQQVKGKGGRGNWRGSTFILPPDMSSQTFGRRIAGIGHLGGMYWSDHETPITPEQLRARFTPVRKNGSQYYWINSDSKAFAVTRTGERAVLDIGELPDPKPAAPQQKAAARSAAAPGAKYAPAPVTGGRRPARRPISPYERPGG